MRTDFPYIFGATALGLLMAGLFGGIVWLATGSWNYGGGAFLSGLYMTGPVAAWLVDRMMPSNVASTLASQAESAANHPPERALSA
jgi:hypothetical protein